jgi:hypothetical protein
MEETASQTSRQAGNAVQSDEAEKVLVLDFNTATTRYCPMNEPWFLHAPL